MNNRKKIFYFIVLALLLNFINNCNCCSSGGSSEDFDYFYTIRSYKLNFDFKDPAIIKVDEYVNTYFDTNAQNNTSLTSNTVSSLSNLTVSTVSSLSNLSVNTISSLGDINVSTISKISNSKIMMWQFREKLYEIKNGYPSEHISLEVTTLSNYFIKYMIEKKVLCIMKV